MWIILGIFFSYSVFALEAFEEIKGVKIIRVLDQNVVMINRGQDDGLMMNDHARLMLEEEGQAARAICLKSRIGASYWRLYRIPNPQTISKDLNYTLVGAQDREIPSPVAELRDQMQEIKDPEEVKKAPHKPDPFLVKGDMPEKLTERDLLETFSEKNKRNFLEQAINREHLKRDLRELHFSVYASPYTRQSINQGESYRYGVRGNNGASKYRLQGQFEQQQTRLKDPLTGEQVSARGTTGQAQFVIHRLSEDTSSLSVVHYNSQYFSELGTPRSHWQIGPVGFTWHLLEKKRWEYFDLSYVPLLDIRTTDVMQTSGLKSEEKVTGLRHGFRLAVKNRLNDKVGFENLLWVRPYQDLATREFETSNLNLSNDLKLIFSLTEKLYLDYQYIYQYDSLWKSLSNLSSVNTINSLNLRYDFSL